MIRRIIITFSLLTCFLIQPSYADQTKPIRIAFPTWPGYGIAFVAKDKGFFGNLPVEIKVIDDITTLYNAFSLGEIDVMGTSVDGMAFQLAMGSKGKAIYISDHSVGGDGIIASKDVKTIQDLKGKSIGFPRAQASHFILGEMLRQNGMKMSDLKGVQFDDAGLAAKAMFSGKVDAAITWEPFLSQAVKSGVGVLLKTTKDYPEINPSGFMVSENVLINRSEDIKKLLIGLVKATTFSLADTDKSSEIMGKNFNLPKAEVIENRKGLQIASPAVNEQYICAKPPKFSIVFNQASKFWKEEKLTDKILPDGSNYISTIGCKYFKLNTNERL